MNQNPNRRNFIKAAAIGAVASLSIPQIVSATVSPGRHKKIKIEKDDVILFQGDSITDWGRDHKNIVANSHGMLGTGYAMLAAAHLLEKYPELDLKIYNRGISGNKVFQLADRWDTDTLAFKPNILSIHVGVNDYWHTITSGYKGTIDNYIADYHKLIERTKQALPDVKLIICEPFAVKGVKAVDDSWYPTFDLFRKAASDIAIQYDAAFVPWQAVTDKALETAPAAYWSLDGVHPSVAGAALMAHAWTETLKG
ncbi:MAG: SGNH/GDSL hydrolase family protein [Mucilaginibacter sp.]